MPARDERIDAIFKKNLKKKSISPPQRRAVTSAAKGHDTLVIIPTGGGKTSVYQAAALLLPGKTVVISPIQVSVQEQLDSIRGKDLPPAEEVAQDGRMNARTEFLVVSPGELQQAGVVDRIRKARPSLLVVDEAHCISEKGHDFKQHYLLLRTLIEDLKRPTVLALTATASPPVQREIAGRLGMKDPALVKQSLERPNLWLGALRFDNEEAKRGELVKRVVEEEKPGFVYVLDAGRAEEMASTLQEAGVKARFIHDGMSKPEQERTSKAFENGEFDVLVATTHFSMGLSNDKVRFVYHYDISDSIESYYQESGRAGRDDKPARALLFYVPSDLERRLTYTSGPELKKSEVQRVVAALGRHRSPVGVARLAREARISLRRAETAVRRLWDVGAANILATGATERRRRIEVHTQEIVEAQKQRRRYDRSRVEMMRSYARTRDCRRVYVLDYFGETGHGPCGYCDNCEAGTSTAQEQDTGLFPPGTLVTHRRWGHGMVLRYDAGRAVVLFDKTGYRAVNPSNIEQIVGSW